MAKNSTSNKESKQPKPPRSHEQWPIVINRCPCVWKHVDFVLMPFVGYLCLNDILGSVPLTKEMHVYTEVYLQLKPWENNRNNNEEIESDAFTFIGIENIVHRFCRVYCL